MSRGAVARVVIAFALGLLFLSQGRTAPFEKDEEARPASITRDIVRHHDWVLPKDSYGEPTRKPPLYYWLSALAVKASGGSVDEAHARLVSIVAGAATATVTAVVAAGALGWAGGWLAFAFLLGIYGFASHAAYARTDMLLTFFLYAGYAAMFDAIEGTAGRRRWLGAGLLLGLAVLTKGPLPLALAALAILAYCILERLNPLVLLAQRWPWQTLGVAVLIGLAWYAAAFFRERDNLVTVQLMQENLGHLLPATMGGTGEAARPPYYIIARFIGASMPLALYLPALLAAPLGKRRAARRLRFEGGLILAVLVLFSVASAKRDDYIVPAFPSLAVLLASLFTPSEEVRRTLRAPWLVLRDLSTVIAAALMIATTGAVVYLAAGGSLFSGFVARLGSSDQAYMALVVDAVRHGQPLALAALLALALGCIFALVSLLRSRGGPLPAYGIALASLASVSLWLSVLRPALTGSRTLKYFSAQVKTVVGDGPLYVLGGPDYEMAFYYGTAPIPWNGSNGFAGTGPVYLLAKTNMLNFMTPQWVARSHEVTATTSSFSKVPVVLLKIERKAFEAPESKK